MKKAILDFIGKYTKHHKFPPTLREIQERFGLASKSHVNYYLDQLEKEKKIIRTRGKHRDITIL